MVVHLLGGWHDNYIELLFEKQIHTTLCPGVTYDISLTFKTLIPFSTTVQENSPSCIEGYGNFPSCGLFYMRISR